MAVDRFDIVLGRIPALFPDERLLLREAAGTPENLLRWSLRDVAALCGRGFSARCRWEPQRWLAEAENISRQLSSGAIKAVSYRQGAYPRLLREIYRPPYLLYYRGRWFDGRSDLAAAVGTRYPSRRALKAGYRLGYELGLQGRAVVSGLALGIDRVVHEGNLDGGGSTAAVLGSGVDRIYPASNRYLAERILSEGGLLLSLYPPGTEPRPYHFPERNQLISGLVREVVIVQAPRKSGALITADYALQQGRELYVHADGLGGRTGAGGLRLAEEGAPLVSGTEGMVCQSLHSASCGEAGRSLAARLEAELDNRIFIKYGQVMRRNVDEGSYTADC